MDVIYIDYIEIDDIDILYQNYMIILMQIK